MADTAVTAQTLIDSSIARAKDPDDTQWTDAQLLIFLNKAYDYIHKLLMLNQSEIAVSDESITLVASTQEYTLATELPDFWAMASDGVTISGVSDPLVPVPYYDKTRSGTDTTDTYPGSYYVTATEIGFIDIPSATAVAAHGTVSCRYFKKNVALTLTDNMPYKNILNEPMATFMDHVAFLKAENNTSELTTLYNALEKTTMDIVGKRVPL